ncbi:MAG: hypothetical protein MJ158_02960, partial [Alphaproteobacteria bacterium]|nr:hypothetical protein [Alphaproteobacteria bacterium]
VGAGTGAAVGQTIFGGAGSVVGAVAGGYYGVKLGGKIGAAYSANEYLYFEDGTCIECDSHQIGTDYECPNNTVVTNGAEAYKCHVTGSGDYWQKYTIPYCTDSITKIDPQKKYKTILKDNMTNNGTTVKSGVVKFSAAVCIYVQEDCDCDDCCGKKKQVVTPEEQDCINAANRGEPANWNNNNCNCGDKMVWNKTAKKCEYKKGNSCEELFSKRNAEGLACCRAGKATTWSDSENKCTCVDTTKKWIWTSPAKYGQCVGQGGADVPDRPVDPVVEPKPQQECIVYTTTEIKCATGNYYKANIPVKLSGTDECEIAKNISDPRYLAALENAICGNPNDYAMYLTGNINEQLSSAQSAISSLNGFFDNEKVSVWKDKDGEFNKARLASDLTAGVVLGTVGGVVSGVVIKKKQVEKGFDALHCTVGGQTVADWGDEFRVGLKQ